MTLTNHDNAVPIAAHTARTEYVVFIPDDRAIFTSGRREVGRYCDDDDEGSAAARALAHVANLHAAAGAREKAKRLIVSRRGEAYAVEQVITITERRL